MGVDMVVEETRQLCLSERVDKQVFLVLAHHTATLQSTTQSSTLSFLTAPSKRYTLRGPLTMIKVGLFSLWALALSLLSNPLTYRPDMEYEEE